MHYYYNHSKESDDDHVPSDNRQCHTSIIHIQLHMHRAPLQEKRGDLLHGYRLFLCISFVVINDKH